MNWLLGPSDPKVNMYSQNLPPLRNVYFAGNVGNCHVNNNNSRLILIDANFVFCSSFPFFLALSLACRFLFMKRKTRAINFNLYLHLSNPKNKIEGVNDLTELSTLIRNRKKPATMLIHLSFSISTLLLLLLRSAWALTVAFTNAAYEGIATGTPFEIEWVGDGTVSRK
jgi:hypothetical protein